MSNYDGEIKIDTKIRTAEAEQKLLNLQNHMVKTANKIDTVTSKMKQMENAKVPTEEYKALQKELDSTNAKAEKLGNTVAKLSEKGTYSETFKNAKFEYMEMRNYADQIEQKMNEMVSSGTAYKDLKGSSQYKMLANNLEVYNRDLELSALKEQKLKAELEKTGNAGEKAFNKIGKSANKTGSLIKTLASRFKGIMLSLLIFNWIYKGWNAMISGIRDGFQNLAKYSEEYNRSISSLKSANAELKNNLASAFAPIVQMAIPYLVKLIGWLNTAANAIAKFFAALQGKTTYTKAVQQNIDYASSIKDVGDSAKKAAGPLAAFDDLNVLQEKDSGSGNDSGEVKGANAFEEANIDENTFKWVEWLKDNFDTILTAVGAIAAGILAWKIASMFTSDLQTLIGIAMAAAGAFVLLSGAVDAWKNGLDLNNMTKMFAGAALVVAGLGIAFGATGAAIGSVIAGITFLIVGIHDIIENGVNLKNGIMVVAGVFMILLATVGGVAAAIGALITGLVLAVIADWDNFKRTVIEPLKVWMNAIVGNFKQVANGIKNILNGIITFIKGVFTGDWKMAWNGIKQIFSGIWDVITGVLKAAVNNMIGILNTAFNVVVAVINAVIAAINKISFDTPEILNNLHEGWGGQHIGFNIPTMTPVNIPYLANGGITTGSTLANIGEAGREAVLPLENNTGWMDDLADKLAARMPAYGTPAQIVMELDGKEFARGELPYFNEENSRIGVILNPT